MSDFSQLANGDGATKRSSADMDVLLTEWRTNLKRASHRLLGKAISRRADTSDLVQESLVQVWRNMDSFYGEVPEQRESLTRKIAKGQAIKLQRKHFAKKRTVARTQFAEMETLYRSDELTADVEKNEETLRLMEALKKISDQHQQVLCLSFFEEMSLKEISEKLGKTYKMTRTLYTASLKALKSQLQEKVE